MGHLSLRPVALRFLPGLGVGSRSRLGPGLGQLATGRTVRRLGATAPLGRVVFQRVGGRDRKSTRLNSSHLVISYAVFCLKKKKRTIICEQSLSAVWACSRE